MTILPAGAMLFHAVKGIDMNVIVAFRSFANTPHFYLILLCLLAAIYKYVSLNQF
jgi:hypothetical protein